MVEVLEPKDGRILDPACGSGGMFVQAGNYIKEKKEKHGEDPKVENLSDFREMIYKKEKDMLLEYKSEIEAVK